MTADLTRLSKSPRWVIVVRRDKPGLYTDLRETFALDDRVNVLLDRRQDDRRKDRAQVNADRRHTPRRTPLAGSELSFWQHAGFCVIYEWERAPRWATGEGRRGRREGSRGGRRTPHEPPQGT